MQILARLARACELDPSLVQNGLRSAVQFVLGRDVTDGAMQAAHKACHTIFEELFLPAAKDRQVQPIQVTQVRDRQLVDQVPPQERDICLCRNRPSLIRHNLVLP